MEIAQTSGINTKALHVRNLSLERLPAGFAVSAHLFVLRIIEAFDASIGIAYTGFEVASTV